MPEGANARTELAMEHADIEGMVQRIASLKAGPERTGLVRETAARFLTHARAEQRYLFPALRRYLPGGEAEVLSQQRRMDAVSAQFEDVVNTHGNDDVDDRLVGRLVLDIQQHIDKQDTMLLPQLLDACPQEEINNIGRQMRYAIHEERSEPTGTE